MTLYYCAFFGDQTAGIPGQQNLSRPVRAELSANFDVTDLSPSPDKIDRFPSLGQVIYATHRLLLARMLGPRSKSITVVDMMHSITSLPSARAGDKLIVLGHDSYSLRAERELAATSRGRARLRLRISTIGWRYVEILLNRLAWRMFFVSQLDELHATGRQTSANIAIPVSPDVLAYSARLRSIKRRKRLGKPRILVSLPVANAAQNRLDKELVEHVLTVTSNRAELTIWGKGSKAVSESLNCKDGVNVSEWVEDYPSFIAGFDLLVYPRLVGSGFHGKLAEALVLGVPCLCADWVGKPLKMCDYDGIFTFTGSHDFKAAYASVFAQLVSTKGLPLPTQPPQAQRSEAIGPLVEACHHALKATY